MAASAVDRVRRAVDAARVSQPDLNAFTFIDDEAVSRAEDVDARLAQGTSPGRLSGIPVGLKDLIDQRDRVTTCGSAFYRHNATRSATVVERLEEAGAVIVGRTGLHEFAFGFSSENPHFGPVRNPWDPETSPGGSSGGTAAAIAAGITPIGIGTDTGGSIRVPAALCGCFGLKPSHGRVPIDGVFPLVPSVDTVGPLADSIIGLEMAYRAMAAEDGPPVAPPSVLTIGVPQPWVDQSPIDPDVARAFERALDALRDHGHHVLHVQLPDVAPPGRIWTAIAEEVTQVHAGFIAAGKPYGDDVEERLIDAAKVGPEEIALARTWQSRLRVQFAAAFADHDLLVTPTVPAMRKEIGNDMIGGQHYRTVLSWFTALVNQSLHPAIAMPLTGSGTPPVSLQLIGPIDSEMTLLAVGADLEAKSIVGFQPAPEHVV